MFSDPFSAIMALILLAFIGTLAIFFRIWRELDAVRRSLGDIRETLQYYLIDVARQNRDLAGSVAELRLSGAEGATKPASAEENIGTLLEKGLPNLMPSSSLDDEVVAPPVPSVTLTFGSADEEDEFLRRFETGHGKQMS